MVYCDIDHNIDNENKSMKKKETNIAIMEVKGNAELIFRANNARGDYHDNKDSATCLLWVERRLVPAFNACFPGKRMIFVLCNAKSISFINFETVRVRQNNACFTLRMFLILR